MDESDVVSERANDQLRSFESPIVVEIDSASGLPRMIGLSAVSHSVTLTTDLRAVLGGDEGRNPTGGLTYFNTEEVAAPSRAGSPIRTIHNGDSVDFEVDVLLGPLELTLVYRLYPTSPYLELSTRIWSEQGVVIRDLRLRLGVQLLEEGTWLLNVPGNMIRRDLAVELLGDEPLGVSPLGGLRGSSGLIALTNPGVTFTIWPSSTSEIVDVTVIRQDPDLVVEVGGLVAASLGDQVAVNVRLATLDFQEANFAEVQQQWPTWASRYGIVSPQQKPKWARSASIYEVQIGTSYFWGGHSYAPYQNIRDVTEDLDRIARLGFTVIQLMPKQPYPSYNVHDYYDVTTSYGDLEELLVLVKESHALGIKVILDVLLHGVLDQESIDRAVDGVKNGPLHDRLDEQPGDGFGSDVADRDSYLLGWSRHILDFAPYWRAGSPPRTGLEDTNPGWFYRDSSGEVTGVYTKAFEARNPDWRDYFRAAMLFLLQELGIDGFRFDAPTYNNFPNWSPLTRLRASASPLGCVPLFVDLRSDIKAHNPDALMYTEPSGHLLRRSMDVNYNYDEQWIVTALGSAESHNSRSITTAAQFMEWQLDRDAFLPEGSLTAHHIDSHDTFWWPEWGRKWRREQLRSGKVRALAATFMSLDGPYMMFTGGETGVEEVLTFMNDLRRQHPELWEKKGEFVRRERQSPDLFWMRRRSGSVIYDFLVNLTGDTPVAVPSEVLLGEFSTEFSAGLVEDGKSSLGPDAVLVLARHESGEQ